MPDTAAVPGPSFTDGYRRGFDHAHGEMREEQIASVFDRDADHAKTLALAVRAIQYGLGHVAESEARKALQIADELHKELERLELAYASIAREHREQAALLAHTRDER